MLILLSRFWSLLRFAWLAATVLLVLGLNQRAVSVLRLPAGQNQPARVAAPPKATVVKQKVMLEATASLAHFVASPAVAWLPAGMPGFAWPPAVRRALAAPRLLLGIGRGALFRTRLLVVALSPQAP